MKPNKVLVIGAGPAGMMAAGKAAQLGADVTILEKNNRLGRKLLITGKGRCNITNLCDMRDFISNIPTNGKFLFSAINNFSPYDTIAFFEENNVKTKVERGSRVFPESDKAVDVVDALDGYVKKQNCKIEKGECRKLLFNEDKVIGCITQDNKEYLADKVIIACGGKSYPLTGSTGDGYILARQAGHTVTKITPSLIPLTSNDKCCKNMQGLSLKNVSITVTNKITKKEIYKDFGEMLFTHFGLSGPIILSASCHIKNNNEDNVSVSIDLKPTRSDEEIDLRIQREILNNINKSIINTLGAMLPRKIIPEILKRADIDFYKKANSITKEERKTIGNLIKNFSIDITGFRPIEEAIITSGGIKTDEINPSTMESKLINNLYFAGEVIDVDGYTGGYNLQIAYSTGVLAGESSAIS